jgi:hypothetical protein
VQPFRNPTWPIPSNSNPGSTGAGFPEVQNSEDSPSESKISSNSSAAVVT